MSSSGPAPSFLRRHGTKLALSLILGGGLAWLLARGGLPLVPPRAAFAVTKPWTVVAYVGTLALVHWFRAARWRFLLRPVGEVRLREVVSVSWIAFLAILLSPFRTGELVRPVLITRRSSVRLWEATGTIGAERVIDGLVLSVMLFVALLASTPLDPLPDRIGELPVPAAAVPRAAYFALALFFTAFVVMGVFFWARRFANRVTHAVIGVVSEGLALRVAHIVESVAAGLSFLPRARFAVPFLVETFLYWAANAGGVWLLAWGAGLDGVTFSEACVVVGCIGIGILVPAGPGYFGAFQLSTYAALAMFFPESMIRGPGAAFVFLIYSSQVAFHLVTGLGALVLDSLTARERGASGAPPASHEATERGTIGERGARRGLT